jgi:hypothetical protein
VPVATRIDCMECGGDAFLAQPLADDDEIEVGQIMMYICRDCAQRWDVVVDDDDLADD